MVLALHTGIAPDVWRRQTDTDIATAIWLLAEQNRNPPPAAGGPQMSG